MSIYVSYSFDRATQAFSASADIYIDPYIDPETFEYFDKFYWESLNDGASQNGVSGYTFANGIEVFNLNVGTGLHDLEVSAYNSFGGGDIEYWQADLANHTLAEFGQHIIGYSEAAGSRRIDIALGSERNDRFSLGRNNDYAEGGGGNDIMDGGSGADMLAGGYGDDRFYVDNAGDRILEASNQGSDVVYTTVSYTLAGGQHIELLATTNLAGTGAINLTGNELAQRINGNNGNNVIRGGGSSDTLVGYGGNDTLDGGAGWEPVRVSNSSEPGCRPAPRPSISPVTNSLSASMVTTERTLFPALPVTTPWSVMAARTG